MVSWIDPLDLQTLFVNTFAGSLEIFMISAFFAVAVVAAYFRMPNTLALIMFGLFGVIVAVYSAEFYYIVILFAGIAIAYGIGSYIRKWKNINTKEHWNRNGNNTKLIGKVEI